MRIRLQYSYKGFVLKLEFQHFKSDMIVTTALLIVRILHDSAFIRNSCLYSLKAVKLNGYPSRHSDSGEHVETLHPAHRPLKRNLEGPATGD